MTEFAEVSEQILRQNVINQLLKERTEILRAIHINANGASPRALEDNTNAIIKVLGEVPQEA